MVKTPKKIQSRKRIEIEQIAVEEFKACFRHNCRHLLLETQSLISKTYHFQELDGNDFGAMKYSKIVATVFEKTQKICKMLEKEIFA